jgi:pimeloyl-ACP methyl ester carboxylesterase
VESTPGVSAVKAKRLNELNELMFSTVYRNSNQPDSILGPLVRNTYTQWRLADDSMMKGKPNQFTDRIMFPQEGYVKQACSKWYRFHIQYNPAQYLPKIKVPVLAVNGDMDIMVPAQVHLPYFKQLITYKKGQLVDTVVLPHTNHLLEYCETCAASAFSKPGWKVSEPLLNQLATWISRQ